MSTVLSIPAQWVDPTALSNQMLDYLDSPGFAPVAILVALAAGAAHGLAPGHGKSLAAAYLVGAQGRVRDAAWLGGSVAIMHTLSCLVLGIAWAFFSLSDLVELKTLTTGLQLVAGLLVVGTGVWLLRRHLKYGGHGHSHDHGHSHGHSHSHGHGQGHAHSPGHSHSHAHSHAHTHTHADGTEHTHSHAPATSRPGLVLLGISGGLTPSPSAFLLLITGIFTGRAGFALVLVISFGLGLASVLFAVGLIAVSGRNLVDRADGAGWVLTMTSRVLPVLTAAGITVLGLGITSLSATQLAAL